MGERKSAMQIDTAMKVLWLTLVMVLTGCQSDEQARQMLYLAGKNADLQSQIKIIKEENFKLEAELDSKLWQRKAELDYLEGQAGLVLGCDFLVPLCPGSVTKVGRQAQTEGIGGGSSLNFWGLVLLKLVAVGGFFIGAIGAIVLLWLQVGKPKSEEVKQAHALVQESEAWAAAAQAKAVVAEEWAKSQQAKAEKLEELNLEASTKLKTTLFKIQEAQASLKSAEAAFVAKKRMTAALSDAF